jgi:1,4-dihydroxy-6-naphthoate synthase
VDEISLGFSPCPNDTFIFDAWVNGRIPSDFRVKPLLADVEHLNRMALHAQLDVTKLSFATAARVADKYQILPAGSALGQGCGPLIVRRADAEVNGRPPRIAIPGNYTTANLLLSIFYPHWTDKREMLFSEIESAVVNGDVDLGLIIHENRFTYQDKGLVKFDDLGERWEQEFNFPIPLGCIAIRRDMPDAVKRSVARTIRQSTEWALAHPADSSEYVAKHAQELTPDVQRQHIALYVNGFSVDLGVQGQAAIRHLFHRGYDSGLLPECAEPLFLDNNISA